MARIGAEGDVSVVVGTGYIGKGVDQAKKDVGTLGRKTKSVTAMMARQYDLVKASVISLQGAIAATAVIVGVRALANAAMDIEEAEISVAKTTGLAGKEMELFRERIRALSLEMKGIEIGELLEISRIAGQMGQKDGPQIASFAQDIAMIAVATDLTAEAAAENFAQITNVMKEPIEKTRLLASVMNELSNNSVATASQIANLTLRMGGAAEKLGLTTPEVMALAATLRETGVEIEVGGTSMSQIMLKMISDVEGFARASGVSFKEFDRTLRDSPIEALQMLLDRLGELDKFKAMEVINSLGLAGTRTSGTLLKLSSGVDIFKEQLARANAEALLGTSIMIEYEAASEGARSTLDLLWNMVKILASEIGDSLLPAIKSIVPVVINATKEFISFAKWLGEIAARASLWVEDGLHKWKQWEQGVYNAQTPLEQLQAKLEDLERQNHEGVLNNNAGFIAEVKRLKDLIVRLRGVEEQQKKVLEIEKQVVEVKKEGAAIVEKKQLWSEAELKTLEEIQKVSLPLVTQLGALNDQYNKLTLSASAYDEVLRQKLVSEGAEVEIVNQLIAARQRLRAEEEAQAAAKELARLEADSPYNEGGGTEIERIIAEYQMKRDVLLDHNTQVIQMMIQAGRSQAEVEARYSQLKMQYVNKEKQLRLQAYAQSFGAAANFMQNLMTVTNSKNKQMFQAMKAFAIAQTMIDAYVDAGEAKKALSGIPVIGPALGIAAAVAAIAAGVARARSIASTEPGTGAGGSVGSTSGAFNAPYGGGSNTASPVPERFEEPQRAPRIINLNVTGDIHDPASLVRLLAPYIDEAKGDKVSFGAL